MNKMLFGQTDPSLPTEENLVAQQATKKEDISLIGKSPAITKIINDIQNLQQINPTSILISGESGTGKELVARAIHGGARAKGPFIAVNCATLDEPSLFGQVQNVDTVSDCKSYFELATGGTLLLDNIDEMSLPLQIELLQVLKKGTFKSVSSEQEKLINVQIIATTNIDLATKTFTDEFSSDLYFRLVEHTVHLSPLRERQEDIPLLVEHFLSQLAVEMNRPKITLTSSAVKSLETYNFPGNVRELRNILEQALISLETNFYLRNTKKNSWLGVLIKQARKKNLDYIHKNNFLFLKQQTKDLTILALIRKIQAIIYEFLFRKYRNILKTKKEKYSLHQVIKKEHFEEKIKLLGISDFLCREAIIKIIYCIRSLQRTKKTNILILGESGIDKKIVARAIHFGSIRAMGPFIAVNCAAIPNELTESILFGHVQETFTSAINDHKGYFELASGGTLFLDEIDKIPYFLQTELSRALENSTIRPVGSYQEKQVDVQVIAATNTNLATKMLAGEFRNNLYFCLTSCTLQLPSLRECQEEISLFIEYLLSESFLSDLHEECSVQFANVPSFLWSMLPLWNILSLKLFDNLTFEQDANLVSEQDAKNWGISAFIGKSQATTKIIDDIRRLQKIKKTNILILGESGTGKELVARAIHFGGIRAKGPFIAVNCAAIPSELTESILFGHVRGAFTGAVNDRKGYFELASGGTLFLDEMGEMPYPLQAKLLRTLENGTFMPVGSYQEKRVDVRVIAATNVNLATKMLAGEFRNDLYFRLAGYTIQLPSLRERREDISLLVDHFLSQLAAEMDHPKKILDSSARELLKIYSFPGNVRELRNILEQAVISSDDGVIRPQHLRFFSDITVSTTNSSSPAMYKDKSIPLSFPKAQQEILTYIRQQGSVTNSECQQHLNVDYHRASYLLKEMKRRGQLVLQGSRRGSYYVLAESYEHD
jgi:DNA-binding NtrC family response regulator